MEGKNILLLGVIGYAGYKLFVDDKQSNTVTNDNPPIDTNIGKRKTNGLDLSSVNPSLPTTDVQTVGVGDGIFRLSNIPIETEPNKFSPQLFPLTIYGTILQNELGFELPKLIVSLHTTYSEIYKNLGVDYTKRGIWESVDVHTHKQEGTQWNFFEDEYYQNNISTRTQIDRTTWVTNLPINKRYFSYGGDLSRAKFESLTSAEQAYNLGRSVAHADEFGKTLVNGINEIGGNVIDWETNYENGERWDIGIPFVWGACKHIKGLFKAMYLWYAYPDDSSRGYPVNGEIPTADINPLFVNTVAYNGETLDLKTLKNLYPLIEISRQGEENFPEGYNDGVRVISHFGANKTARHYLKRTVAIAEKNYFGWRKTGNKFIGLQAKTVCDTGTMGWQYENGTRPDGKQKARFSQYLDRDKAFKSTLAAVFSGCHIHEWDRPDFSQNNIIDGYNGLEGAREILGHKFDVNGTQLSFVDLRDNEAYFPLWEVMYKMTGETNFSIIEGCNLDSSVNQLLPRVMTSGKYICVFICDAYNTANNHNITVKYQNEAYRFEKAFDSADWHSCYPRPSIDAPKRYDYVFGIYEMSVR